MMKKTKSEQEAEELLIILQISSKTNREKRLMYFVSLFSLATFLF